MKKIMTLIVTVVLAVCACFSMTGCGKEKLNFGKELVKLDAQLDTLTQLKNGSIDVSIIDSVMGGWYCTTGDFKDDIEMISYTFAEEAYGIAGRKSDKALISKINDALIGLDLTNVYDGIAATYGLTNSLASLTTNPITDATDNSWTKIKESGKIIIGYTVFAPIAYEVVGTVPTKGFDIDLAKAVFAALNLAEGTNLAVEFVEIDWDSKETLLDNGTIDLIWNGMTITPEREAGMCISIPYLKNYQCAIVRKADASKYAGITQDNLVEKMKDSIIGVEGGSAGEGVVVAK